MTYRDLSVSSKVMTAFACVLVATIALGVFATDRLSKLNGNAAETTDHWVPAMQALSAFQYNSTRFRSFSSTYLLPCSDKERDGTLKLLETSQKKTSEALNRFITLATTDKDRALGERLEAAWDAYEPMRDQQVALYKSGGLPAAAAYFMGPMRAAFKKVTEATDDAIAYNADGAQKSGSNSHATYASARIWIFAAIGLALLLCSAAWLSLVRSVSKPLSRMTDAMGEMAQGRTDVEIPEHDRKDEIGRLADAMASFVSQLAAAERSKAVQTETIVASIGTGLHHLAGGDLTHRVVAELTGPFVKLKEDFNAAMTRLEGTVRQVLASSDQISTGANEISTAADDLSRRTEQQAASLEETAAALEEITATVKKTAANAKESETGVAGAKHAAEEGGRVVHAATEAMDAIAQSSKQITDIIGVIDEIAFQTNLLALNAGVEAARAGDAGRGFAVVASEVRALAQRSSHAAKEIKTLIHASSDQVANGVNLVGQSGEALNRIVAQVQEINGLVIEMARAAEQEATGIEQVNAAVGQMDQVTQQNAAMVEQSTAASRSLAGETQALQNLIAFFRVGGPERCEDPAPREEPAPRAIAPRAVAPAPRPRARAVRSAVAVAVARAPQAEDWTEF
jgi:methyl-accepting chemotaxis protein